MTTQEYESVQKKLDAALLNLSSLMDRNNIIMETGLVKKDERIDRALVSIQQKLLKSKASLSN